MKAITLYPEWAWPILFLDKRVENRGWPIPKAMAGQLVALHAGKHIGGRPGGRSAAEGQEGLVEMASRAGWDLLESGNYYAFTNGTKLSSFEGRPIVRSAIVAFIRFGPSVPPNTGDLTGWRVPDCHGWPIVEVMRLKEPAPVDRGALGFWELPSGILERCREVGTVEDEQVPLFREVR